MEEKSNGELAFLDKESVARKVFFSPCLIKHISLSQIKMTYTKKALELIKC